MADTKVSALSSFTPITTDLLYGVDDPGGTPVSGKLTISDIFALAARSTLAAGTLTADSPHQITQTWNNAGVAFTGVKVDVTNTASAAASNLLDLLVGGVSKFAVRKAGSLRSGGATAADPHDLNIGGTGRFGFFQASTYVYTFGYSSSATGDTGSLAPIFSVQGSSRFIMNSGLELCWASGSIVTADGDLKLVRSAADTLALRRGTNAQTMLVNGTFTDLSNYRHLFLGMSTTGVAQIKPEGAGTGATGNVLHISGLPTSNPGPGILWNNGGTVEVGT